ncbi:hypothetical protein VYU27_007129 [Nannochloropsis oceanica]
MPHLLGIAAAAALRGRGTKAAEEVFEHSTSTRSEPSNFPPSFSLSLVTGLSPPSSSPPSYLFAARVCALPRWERSERGRINSSSSRSSSSSLGAVLVVTATVKERKDMTAAVSSRFRLLNEEEAGVGRTYRLSMDGLLDLTSKTTTTISSPNGKRKKKKKKGGAGTGSLASTRNMSLGAAEDEMVKKPLSLQVIRSADDRFPSYNVDIEKARTMQVTETNYREAADMALLLGKDSRPPTSDST